MENIFVKYLIDNLPEFTFGLLVGLLGVGRKWIIEQRTLQKSKELKERETIGFHSVGIRAMLKFIIIQKCKECLQRGYSTEDDLEELFELNAPYRSLGGNGIAKTLIGKVKALPIKSDI